MSSGRGVAFAGTAMVAASAALVVMVFAVREPRPVDVRQVDRSPVGATVLSATHTTTVMAARSTTPLVVVTPAAPPPEPPPHLTTAATTTTEEPPLPVPSSSPPLPSAPESTSSSRPQWEDGCDLSYSTDGICVPWRFPRGVWRYCDWLREQGVTRIEVRDRDRHHLDLDHDGTACERND